MPTMSASADTPRFVGSFGCLRDFGEASHWLATTHDELAFIIGDMKQTLLAGHSRFTSWCNV